MNNKIALLIVGAVVIIGGAILLFAMPTPSTTPSDETSATSTTATNETEGMMAEGAPEEEMDNDMVHEQTGTIEVGTEVQVGGETVKEFTVSGTNCAYSVKEMRVKKGDRVRVNFTSENGFHDWVIDEIPGAKTGKYNTGGSETIEFTATEAGTFEYYCSVGTHRQMGMVGKFIVE